MPDDISVKSMNKLSLFASCAILGIIVGTAGCSRKSVEKKNGAAPVVVAQAIVTNVPVEIQPLPVGHVMAYSSVTVRSQITGILEKIHFQEGQEVKAGDLLFTIDPRPSQAALEAARAALTRDQAQLANAKIQFERNQQLFSQKLISQDEFDTSKATLDSSLGTVAADAAAVTNAELNVEYCEIRAPFDGKTGSLQFHEGNVIKAQDDTLLTINRIHPIYVAFAVPERYLPQIKQQMSVRRLATAAEFDGMSGESPKGELTFIDNAVDTTTGTIQLRSTFPNEDSVLWPGQFVRVTLALSELTNAIVVPSQAVQTGQDGEFTYVVKPDQTVEERPLKIGFTYHTWIIVESGLKAGEKVVIDGQLRLKPGANVEVRSPAEKASQTADQP